jgi:hypothetical protein
MPAFVLHLLQAVFDTTVGDPRLRRRFMAGYLAVLSNEDHGFPGGFRPHSFPVSAAQGKPLQMGDSEQPWNLNLLILYSQNHKATRGEIYPATFFSRIYPGSSSHTSSEAKCEFQ